MELHHPIMSKIWDIGGRTKRKKNAKFTNGQIIRPIMEWVVDLPMLQSKSRQAHILPNINQSLVYIGTLRGTVCTVKFRIKMSL